MSVTPRARVLALAGLLLLLAVFMGMRMLSGRAQSSSSAPLKVIKPLHPYHKQTVAKAPATSKSPSKVKAHPPAAKKQSTTPTLAPPKVPPVKTAKPATAPPAKQLGTPAVDDNALPPPVAAALRRNSVVVAALWAPGAPLDAAVALEAQQGADMAGAAYVRLDVLKESISRPLARKFGVLEDPGVLVFQSPDQLVLHFNGFTDRDTIAQAAQDAFPATDAAAAHAVAPSASPAAAAWTKKANAICASARSRVVALGTPTSRTQLLARGPKALAIERRALVRFAALPAPPAAIAPHAKALVAGYARFVAREQALLTAYRSGNSQATQAAVAASQAAAGDVGAAASALGAPDCVSEVNG